MDEKELEKAISARMDTITDEEIKERLVTMLGAIMHFFHMMISDGIPLSSEQAQDVLGDMVALRKAMTPWAKIHVYTEEEKAALYKAAKELDEARDDD